MIPIRVLPKFGEEEKVEEWSLSEVLEEINRDRSDKWTNYDESDWVEGWLEWIDGEFYQIVDLFPFHNQLPKDVLSVLERYESVFMDGCIDTYEGCVKMQREMNELGYDFEWGLDAIPYNLHKKLEV